MKEPKELSIGKRLMTKDGRKVGNAIVTSRDWSKDPVVYTIRTDFGNTAKLTLAEIEDMFYLEDTRPSHVCPYKHLKKQLRYLVGKL